MATDRSAAARRGWATRRARLRPGEESSDAGVVLVPERNDPDPDAADGVKIGTQIVSAGFALDIRADFLVDAIAQTLLVHHHKAISTGQKPEGGPQRPLSEGRRNDADRAGPFRGYKSGHLADDLRRGKITGTTAKATTRVLPPTDRNAFLATEAARGVHYLTTDGAAGEVARAAAHGCWRGTAGPAGISPKYFCSFSRAISGVMSPASTMVVLAAP